MRYVELPRAGPLLSPHLDEFSILRELHDAVVAVPAMPVRDKNIAIWSNCHSGRHIECVRTISGDSRLAESHQHFSIRAELEDLLAFSGGSLPISDPDVSILIHREPMRKQEHALANTLQKFAGGIKFEDGRKV